MGAFHESGMGEIRILDRLEELLKEAVPCSVRMITPGIKLRKQLLKTISNKTRVQEERTLLKTEKTKTI